MGTALPYDVVKEALAGELVTKADFAELRGEMREEIIRLEAKFEARFVRLEIWLKVLVGIMLAGFTIFNPGFHQALKTIIAYVGA